VLRQAPDFERILTIEEIATKDEYAGLWMVVVGWIGRIAVSHNITAYDIRTL
jgi:hypothetical protein